MKWSDDLNMNSTAQVHFFDVGQGDSILIELPTDEIIIIDCHVSAESTDRKPPVLSYLQQNAKKRKKPYNIDLLCLTHPDRDHYRGMNDLLDWIYEQIGRASCRE